MTVSREQISLHDRWDLKNLYLSDAAWQQDCNQVSRTDVDPWTTLNAGKDNPQGTPESIAALLDALFDLNFKHRKLSVYAQARHDENRDDETGQALIAKVYALKDKIDGSTSWFSHQLKKNRKLLSECIQSDYLKNYRFYLMETERSANHAPSPQESQLLTLAAPIMRSPHLSYQKLVDVDLKFEDAVDSRGIKHPLSKHSFASLMSDDDSQLRQSAYVILHGEFANFRNVFAQLLDGTYASHLLNARASKFSSTLECHLFENDLSPIVYENVIQSIRNRASSYQRYLALRSKMLNVDQLGAWDLQNKAIGLPDTSASFDLESAKSFVLEACAPLGTDYVDALKKGLTHERWFDLRESKGKRSGGFKYACAGFHPLAGMSFADRQQDVLTLAVLAGYTMHSYFSAKEQPFHLSGISDITTKACAHLNQQLVLYHRVNSADQPQKQAQLLAQELQTLSNSLFKNNLFTEFESQAHAMRDRGETLTAEKLETLYLSLCKHYYGTACHSHPLAKMEWAAIHQLHHEFQFFPSVIATCAGLAMFEQLKLDPSSGQKRVLNLLKAGVTDTPLNLLSRAGVDLASPDTVNRALDHFDELVNQLEKLVETQN